MSQSWLPGVSARSSAIGRMGKRRVEPKFAEIEKAAAANGIKIVYQPVATTSISDQDAVTFGKLLEELPQPLVVYCRSGLRSTALWALSQSGNVPWKISSRQLPGPATTSSHFCCVGYGDPVMSGSTAANAVPEFDAGFRAKLADLVLWRRDVRKFRPDRLPAGSMDRLLRLACLCSFGRARASPGASCSWRTRQNASASARISEQQTQRRSRHTVETGRHVTRLSSLKGWMPRPCNWRRLAVPDPEQGAKVGRRTMPETVAYSVVTAIHTFWLAARAEGIGEVGFYSRSSACCS